MSLCCLGGGWGRSWAPGVGGVLGGLLLGGSGRSRLRSQRSGCRSAWRPRPSPGRSGSPPRRSRGRPALLLGLLQRCLALRPPFWRASSAVSRPNSLARGRSRSRCRHRGGRDLVEDLLGGVGSTPALPAPAPPTPTASAARSDRDLRCEAEARDTQCHSSSPCSRCRGLDRGEVTAVDTFSRSVEILDARSRSRRAASAPRAAAACRRRRAGTSPRHRQGCEVRQPGGPRSTALASASDIRCVLISLPAIVRGACEVRPVENLFEVR